MKTTEKMDKEQKSTVSAEELGALLYEALETELGGVKVYEAALECVEDEELRKEWEQYLGETRHHVEVLEEVFEVFGLDTDAETPARAIVRQKGEALVAAMESARRAGNPGAAQIVAAECVVDAETKDHQNWELLGMAADALKGAEAKALKKAHEEVEDEEDEHLYHTAGWARELWIEALGLPAVLPPPEEEKDVRTAMAAARAKKERKSMVPRGRSSGSRRSERSTTRESSH
jgi:ferritin-like metal-binding protein YciE